MALVPPLNDTIRVTSVYGEDRGSYIHQGLDLALQNASVHRQPVRAPVAGVVVATWTTAEANDGFPYGNAVALRATGGAIWRFLHFAEPPSLTPSDTVAVGDVLGLAGTTGNSTGPHVHLDVTPAGSIIPGTFLVAGQRIDPLHHYADAYAHDAGLDPAVFRQQIATASDWNPFYDEIPGSRGLGREGIAGIDVRIHPVMRGQTFDPFASLQFAATLTAQGLDRHAGDLAEALADVRVGALTAAPARAIGRQFARDVLAGRDVQPRSRANAPPQPATSDVPDRSERRFGRTVRVEIDRSTVAERPFGLSDPLEAEEARVIVRGDGLRIAFELQLEAQPDAAPSTVRLYNLARPTARRIRGGAAMQLHAGYADAVGLLHGGEILQVDTERVGLDRITTLTLGNQRATQVAGTIFSGGFRGALELRALVASIVASMGLSLGYTGDIPAIEIESYAYHGKAADALTALLRPRGVEWWVQNEEVLFSAGGRVRPEPARLVAERTGMIGSPTMTDDGVRVVTLLDHGFRLAQPVHLESEGVTGPFKVTAITHRGDSWEGEFATELECVAA